MEQRGLQDIQSDITGNHTILGPLKPVEEKPFRYYLPTI